MSRPSLTEEQIARRDQLRDVVITLSLILNPDPLTRLRRLQGLAYAELDALGDGRQEVAELIGLGPKAIDWARNRAKSTPGPDIDILVEFRDLLVPLLERLAPNSA